MHDHTSDAASAMDKWVPRRPLDVAPPDQFRPVGADSRIDQQLTTTDDAPELFDDRATRRGPDDPVGRLPADPEVPGDAP